MKKISIVGAGWLGLPLGKSLAEKGHAVLGTTTREEKLSTLNEQRIKGMVLNLDEQSDPELSAVMECDILIVTVPPGRGEASYRFRLEQLRDAAIAAEVRQVIFISSTSVYPAKNGEVREQDGKMIASSHSGVQLLAMENIFRQAEHLDATIIRFGGLFGPDRHPGHWLAARTNVAGADNPTNMIHLTDCIRVIETIIEKEAWGMTFNAVSPSHTSRRAFYDAACADLGLEPPRWNDEKKPWKKVNSEKIISELNFSFTFNDPRQAFQQIPS